MIHFEVQELTKGFSIAYFDSEQPSELDSEHVWFETFEEMQRYLADKLKATVRWRKKEEEKNKT